MRFLAWCRNKFGRIMTAMGGAMTLADLDLSPIKEPLESCIGHKGVQAVVVLLFLASYLRHHSVAQLHPN